MEKIRKKALLQGQERAGNEPVTGCKGESVEIAKVLPPKTGQGSFVLEARKFLEMFHPDRISYILKLIKELWPLF